MGSCPPAGAVAEILGLRGWKGVEEEVVRVMGCDPAHGWPHVVRVAGWAEKILKAEKLEIDRLVLYFAVVVHDVGRGLEGEGHHAVKSARWAEEALRRLGMEMLSDNVVHAILAHSYSLGVKAETLEAKVLSDADKLDALGAVGVARVFHYGCQLGRQFEDGIEHAREKLLRLPQLMHFPYSRRAATELARRLQVFFEWLEEELGADNVKL
ncbi:MAG: HD domain-containing protein [Desulfurococcales archaeon]|nr:HD domain-containing protein [Desulfurococcales archaeon]